MTKGNWTLFKCFIFSIGLLLSSNGTGQVLHDFTIHFESNSFELSKPSKVKIDSVLSLMTNIPEAYGIDVKGYTDKVGSAKMNKRLSLKRASSTANYFFDKGFLKEKVGYSGDGISNDALNNSTDIGRAENRRVNILISIKIPEINTIGGLELKADGYK